MMNTRKQLDRRKKPRRGVFDTPSTSEISSVTTSVESERVEVTATTDDTEFKGPIVVLESQESTTASLLRKCPLPGRHEGEVPTPVAWTPNITAGQADMQSNEASEDVSPSFLDAVSELPAEIQLPREQLSASEVVRTRYGRVSKPPVRYI